MMDPEEGEDSWIKRIDRGGLWHVNEGIYVLFYAMEEIIRQHFTVKSIESLDSHTKDQCLYAVLKNDDIKHHWSTVASHIDDNTGNFVLHELVRLYLTIRGHAFVSSCMELYKQRHSKKIQKSKALWTGLASGE